MTKKSVKENCIEDCRKLTVKEEVSFGGRLMAKNTVDKLEID